MTDYDHYEVSQVISHLPEYTEEDVRFAEAVIDAIQLDGVDGIELRHDSEMNAPYVLAQLEDDLATFYAGPLSIQERDDGVFVIHTVSSLR